MFYKSAEPIGEHRYENGKTTCLTNQLPKMQFHFKACDIQHCFGMLLSTLTNSVKLTPELHNIVGKCENFSQMKVS